MNNVSLLLNFHCEDSKQQRMERLDGQQVDNFRVSSRVKMRDALSRSPCSIRYMLLLSRGTQIICLGQHKNETSQ